MPRAADHPVLALLAAAVLLASPLLASASAVKPADRSAPATPGTPGTLGVADRPLALIVPHRDAHPSCDELRPVKPTDPLARSFASLTLTAHRRPLLVASIRSTDAVSLYTRLARLTL